MNHLSKRQRLEKRFDALKAERASWEPQWRDICEQMIPYRAVWDAKGERNRGHKKESKIINNTPVRAIGTLSSGMMAGITSPARKWFKLTTADRDLKEFGPVKAYLESCQEAIATALQLSNFYGVLANSAYRDLGGIGTTAIFEDETDIGLHFRDLPIGQYYLDHDHNGTIDTCFRKLAMTVRQMAQRFGRNALSPRARDAYDKSDLHHAFDVVHAVFPNEDHQQGRIGPEGMRWASCWWEIGNPNEHQLLSEGGYEMFPVLAPRWLVRPGDVYGRGPGWEVRGDCRTLQKYERDGMAAADKIVDPPMVAHPDIKRASLLPGDRTNLPKTPGATFEPAIKVDPRTIEINELRIARTEQRIEKSLFVDLWRALIDDERNQRPTATEVEFRREEKMLALGPLLENLDKDLLDPVIERPLLASKAGHSAPFGCAGRTCHVRCLSDPRISWPRGLGCDHGHDHRTTNRRGPETRGQ